MTTDKRPAAEKWRFHSHANTNGLVAVGSEIEARSYLAHLNQGRVLSLWSLQKLPTRGGGKGNSLADLLAKHAAAHHAANAATRRLLHHGNAS